jgi:hypothetical protein
VGQGQGGGIGGIPKILLRDVRVSMYGYGNEVDSFAPADGFPGPGGIVMVCRSRPSTCRCSRSICSCCTASVDREGTGRTPKSPCSSPGRHATMQTTGHGSSVLAWCMGGCVDAEWRFSTVEDGVGAQHAMVPRGGPPRCEHSGCGYAASETGIPDNGPAPVSRSPAT